MPSVLNGEYSWASMAFTQDSVTTYRSWQYAVWVDDLLDGRIARRRHGQEWEPSINLSDQAATAFPIDFVKNLHRVICVGVDARGYIHVVGNVHTGVLRYMRSVSPNDPSSWVTPGMIGTEETQVTYPTFVKLPSGVLLFTYREGGSLSGNWYLNVFNPAALTWSRRALLFDGVSDSVAAYPHRFAVDKDTGRIHVTFTWRDGPNAADNENICYAYSDDEGVTWRETNGSAYTLPITQSTSEVLFSIPRPSGILNSGGMAVDSGGNPHAAWMITPDGDSSRQIHHLYYDGAAWHLDQITNFTSGGAGRPSVVCLDDGTVSILGRSNADGRPNNVLRSWNVTDPDNPIERVVYDHGRDLLDFTPVIDQSAMLELNEVHTLVAAMRSDGLTGNDPADLTAQNDAAVVVLDGRMM